MQRGLVRLGVQAHALGGAALDRRDDLAVFHRLEAVDRRRRAPVADVFAEELVGVVRLHAVFRHGHGRLRHHARRELAGAEARRVVQHVLDQLRLRRREVLALADALADVVRDLHRRTAQVLKRAVLLRVAADELAVLVHAHLVRVCKEEDAPAVARRMLADVHRGGHVQHRRLVLIDAVNVGGELLVAEHVHHAVIADPVARAEVLVRVVVEHAPAEGAGDVLFAGHGVEHARVAHGVLQAVLLAVKRLRGVHVPVVFADQIRLRRIAGHGLLRLAAGVRPVVEEIVVGIDVLEQMALLVAADAAGRARRVEPVRRRVRARIERVVVAAFVDAHAPEDDARVVAVLLHHLLGVAHGLLLPLVAADVLPAGDLREDEQTQLVAPVDEVRALRIVARAHGVEAELVF